VLWHRDIEVRGVGDVALVPHVRIFGLDADAAAGFLEPDLNLVGAGSRLVGGRGGAADRRPHLRLVGRVRVHAYAAVPVLDPHRPAGRHGDGPRELAFEFFTRGRGERAAAN
jgi:hypothetical protein